MSVAAEETRDELNEIVERAADPARTGGVTVATHTLIGSAAQALCDLAESVGADLLVVGNRGMKGGRRFLGSVPNTISHHAPCSVLWRGNTAVTVLSYSLHCRSARNSRARATFLQLRVPLWGVCFLTKGTHDTQDTAAR